MKKIFVFLCSLFLVLGVAGGANAAFFTLDHYDVNLKNADPGLVLQWAPELSMPVSGNLDLGIPQTVDLFSIWTDETDVGWDDMVAYPISVDFYFTQPTPAFSGSIYGETFGVSLLGIVEYGKVEWDSGSIFNFGPLGDGELRVSLSDEIFNKGLFGLKEGERYGAIVEATFKLKNEASPVPEPATMLLLGSGLVGLAGYGRKKFKKK